MNGLIVCVGDAVIDFMPLAQPGTYERTGGGGPANVSVAAAKTGAKTAFCGMVGDDVFGHYLSDKLVESGVDVSGMCFTREATTTMTFVTLDESGDRDFVFARKPGADMLYAPEDVDENLIGSAPIVHFCSIMLSCEGLRNTTEKILRIARESGAVVSFDVNYRQSHWKDNEDALPAITQFIGDADILKLSEEEALWCSSSGTIERSARYFIDLGKPAVITLGSKGALFIHNKTAMRCDAFPIKPVNTTGTGDAFWGAFLAQLAADGTPIEGLSMNKLTEMIVRCSASGAIAATKPGAIDAMPDIAELNGFLATNTAPNVKEMIL